MLPLLWFDLDALDVTISFIRITFSCCRSDSSLISRTAVIGNPSFSFMSIRIRFSATRAPVVLSLAFHTCPYVPSPTWSIFSKCSSTDRAPSGAPIGVITTSYAPFPLFIAAPLGRPAPAPPPGCPPVPPGRRGGEGTEAAASSSAGPGPAPLGRGAPPSPQPPPPSPPPAARAASPRGSPGVVCGRPPQTEAKRGEGRTP